MEEFKKGDFCKSISGHDKEVIYIIVDIQNEILVADGKYKKLKNPKKKNPKHLQNIKYSDEALKKKIISKKVYDEDIKYSIKQYLIHMKNMQEVSECQNQTLLKSKE